MEVLELTEEEIDDYLSVALSNASRVGPKARKQLRGLMKYYAKKKHPFTACVRDNTKRFGKDRAERICAVLKDLIRGTTKWRGKEGAANMSEEEVNEFTLDLDETTQLYLDEIDEDYVNKIIATEEQIELAAGDVVWKPEEGYSAIRNKVQEALNEDYANSNGYSDYWIEDISSKQALVCHKGTDYYIVPFKTKGGDVELSDEDSWTSVERAYVEANLMDEPQTLAEMYFDDSGTKEEGDLIWKTVLREGEWKFSPGPGQLPINKPIKVVKDGRSDGKSMTISIEEIKNSFTSGAKEHVTVPTSHEDKVHENTGFVKDVRVGEDENGRAILEAGIEFTEPDIKDKVKRGTIANTSAGILFDYIQKESGKKFNAIMAHTALTNSPWLNGMKPFGVEASENLQVVTFSEVNNENPADDKGGNKVPETDHKDEVTPTFLSELGLSEDEVRSRLSEYETLRQKDRENDINTKIKTWEDEKKAPAVLTVAKEILMADEGAPALNLSEGGKTVSLTVSEIVERFVAASPKLNLEEGEEKVTDKKLSEGRSPDNADEENELADLSLSEKTEATALAMTEKISEAEAVERVRAKRTQS